MFTNLQYKISKKDTEDRQEIYKFYTVLARKKYFFHHRLVSTFGFGLKIQFYTCCMFLLKLSCLMPKYNFLKCSFDVILLSRLYPNGVDTGYGSHISLFVYMMQSDWDDTLEWPFSGEISLSILDQSDDGEYKRHISETLVTRPTLSAFHRPKTPRNHKGYKYVEFALIETLQDRQYLKNDCLLIRVQVFH